ncbi:uncharacterized protein MICPUCDRAFT_10952, partial [Micromonas pusilla CCMP1545]
RFVDIGANLTDAMFAGEYHGKRYHDADLPAVLRRAWNVGVEKIVVTAGTLEDATTALDLAEAHDGESSDEGAASSASASASSARLNQGRRRRRLYTTVGVHPTRCGAFEASGDAEAHLASLAAIASANSRERGGRVVAIGECGLDYDRLQFCDAETQRVWFRRQFELAKSTRLPMFLHMRAAADDFIEILAEAVAEGTFTTGVVHSFDGSVDDLKKLLAIDGVFIGVNGCSLRAAESLATLRELPVDRVMLETDAPWCGIKRSHAGYEHVRTTWTAKDKKKFDEFDETTTVKDRCEPCHVVQVLEVLSRAMGVDEDVLADACHANAMKVFFPDEE